MDAPLSGGGARPAAGRAATGRQDLARRAEQALTGVAVVVVGVAAAWDRVGDLSRVAVDRDWSWFLRAGEQLAHGYDWGGPVMFMYPRASSGLIGLLGRLLDGPWAAVAAFTVLCSLAMPLSLLAVRQVAGLPAGLVAAGVLWVSASQRAIGVGLKSPYMLPAVTALLALGLVASAHRRPWALPLVAFAGSASVCLHVGTGPAAVFAGLLALGGLPLLAGWRQRLGSVLGAVAAGGPLSAWVLLGDLPRLLGSLRSHQGRSVEGAQPVQELLLRLQQGLSLTLETARPLALVAVAGLVLGLVWALLPAPAERLDARRAHRARWSGSVQVLLLAGVLLAPYLENLYALRYAEVHHFVGAVPPLVVALAGLSAAILPPRVRVLGWLLAAASLLPWLRDARDIAPSRPSTPVAMHLAAPLLDLGQAMRDQSEGRQPVVIALTDQPRASDLELVSVVATELPQLRRAAVQGQPPTCFLLFQGAVPPFALALPALSLPTLPGLDVRHDEDCQATRAQAATFCQPAPGQTPFFRQPFGHPLAEDELLGACPPRPR
ncbi:hypothetical protein L6R53_03895 [Myxococcota bacterium]|nr:hypothetical protein [Myxococcota bacterium]